MSVLIRSLIVVGLLNMSSVQASDPMSMMLPVITPELTPGEVRTTQAPSHIDTPLFIVGDDPLSHRWLTLRAPYLKSINAMGIIVNVKTQAGLVRMKSYGLPIYPVPGRDFAKAFNLLHYPVLIEDKQIKQ